jgi:hypothetical protein
MAEKVFSLSKSIKAHGKNGAEDLAQLTLREPTASDVFDLEMPFRTFASMPGPGKPQMVELQMNGPAVAAWIARLSGHDKGVLGAMTAQDMRKIYDWLIAELNPAGN